MMKNISNDMWFVYLAAGFMAGCILMVTIFAGVGML